MTLNRQRPSIVFNAFVFLVMTAGAMGALRILSLHGLAEWHRLKAGRYSEQGYSGLAAQELETAVKLQPHDESLFKMLGDTYYRMALISRSLPRRVSLLEQAHHSYRTATRLNPLDAQAFHDLGKTLSKMAQKDLPGRDGLQGTEPALAALRNAVRLRPSGRTYNASLLKYLSLHQRQEDMVPVILNLISTDPIMYAELNQEGMCSGILENTCEEGLETAIQKGIAPDIAHRNLSQLAEKRGNYNQSIYHFQKGLEKKATQTTADELIRLAGLFLEGGQPHKAVQWFVRAVSKGTEPEKTMTQIYTHLRNKKRLPLYEEICRESRKIVYFTYRMEILFARSLIDQNRMKEAKAVLNSINQTEPRAEAYYWLSQIARIEGDWDEMELAIQKATVYDPGNSHYRMLFANVLRKLNKQEQAERQAKLAKAAR